MDNTKFHDIINLSTINEFKDYMSSLCLFYNILVNPDANKKRESDNFNIFINQYNDDLTTLSNIRKQAQNITDLTNKLSLKIAAFDQYRDSLVQDVPEQVDESDWDDDM